MAPFRSPERARSSLAAAIPAFRRERTLTSRTVEFISQSTITQREVQSNPDIADPNSPLSGPGYVAPIGIGNHFPPGVLNAGQVDLFGIEQTNRGINIPTSDLAIDPGTGLPVALPNTSSYGEITGLLPTGKSPASPRCRAVCRSIR